MKVPKNEFWLSATQVDADAVLRLRLSGLSRSEVAKMVGVATLSVDRILARLAVARLKPR